MNKKIRRPSIPTKIILGIKIRRIKKMNRAIRLR